MGRHTYGWNKVSISICFMGDFMEKLPNDIALHTAKEIIKYGVLFGKIVPNYRLYGHRDVRNTLGPGDQLYKEIQTWENYDFKRPITKPVENLIFNTNIT